ncbi:MAG: helix-turn-helix transcriptional regulator [Oscillospiraceae bacterium]|nr:helix-turn-helix transcriptional regulator [Oscillospiraceae bacterium]
MKLGQKLKEARIAAGLKQEELAKQLGVSRQTISSWENDRSYPDLGSAVKLSNLYGQSLDEMLKDGDSVIRAFEDLAAKRRKFWQMMLEIGIILELVGILLAAMNFVTTGYIAILPGVILVYIAIVMHLRVFDHDRGEILRGVLGVCILLTCQVLLLADFTWPDELLRGFVLLIAHALIWSAGIWTIDWNSTRLWLIIVLFLSVYILPIGLSLQKSGNLNTANPFGESYQVEKVLHPKDMIVPEYTKVDLSGSWMYFENRDGDRTGIGRFSYSEPVEGQSQKGIWQLIPEDAPDTLYKLTVEADDSVQLSYYEQEQLVWRWLLSDYGRDACAITVPTFGSTVQMKPDWYAPGREDPEPFWSRMDIIGSGKLHIVVAGLPTEALTLTEEYHHGDSVETTTYTLEPERPYSFTMELETRYDGEEEWALYRIPYQDGEYRFTLTFGK